MDHYNKGKKFGGDRGGKKFGGGRGGRSFGGGDRGGRGGFGGGRDGDRQMHRAVCDDCGNNCEVPFRPTGEKPIFCSDCFASKRDGQRDRGDREYGGRDSKPRYDKRSQQGGGQDSANYKAQFEMLNSKLDRIIKALNLSAFDEKIKSTKKEIVVTSESKKFKKAPKAKADKTALKKAIKKTTAKKTAVKKKPVVKKPAVKKAVKKATVEKKPAKKAVTKKKK